MSEKRLLQRYGNAGADSRVRITLPSGSYVPEFAFVSGSPYVLEPASRTEPAHESHAAPVRIKAPWWKSRSVLATAVVTVLGVASGWLALEREILGDVPDRSLILAAFQGSPGPRR
jgi:hypothetical protein